MLDLQYRSIYQGMGTTQKEFDCWRINRSRPNYCSWHTDSYILDLIKQDTLALGLFGIE
jgi:hypothetical protein